MFLKEQDMRMWSGFIRFRTGAGGSILVLRTYTWRSRIP